MIHRAIAAIAAVSAAAPAMLRADVVSLAPSKDNTLYESLAEPVSNGAGPVLFAGKTSFTSLLRRGLIAFDIAAAVPAGSTITSVALTLHMSRTLTGDESVSLHRTLAAWGEGTSIALGQGGGGAAATANDATWLHTFYPGQLWSTPGGQFQPTPSASLPIGGIGFYTWASTPALIADAQGWLDAPSTNHGWVISYDAPIDGSSKRFDSRENANPAFRPVLFIEFTPPCLSDFNHDQFSDAIDYDEFITAWLASDPSSDLNHDEFSDAIDYDLFITAWLSGC